MLERDITFYIIDILIAIDKIKRFSSPFNSGSDLLHNELEWDACIRELQVIGDAVNQLLKSGIVESSFRRIVDFRNQIIHGYFGIDEDIVWQVISKKLLILENSISNIVKNKNMDLSEVITFAKNDNSYNKKVLEFLNKL